VNNAKKNNNKRLNKKQPSTACTNTRDFYGQFDKNPCKDPFSKFYSRPKKAKKNKKPDVIKVEDENYFKALFKRAERRWYTYRRTQDISLETAVVQQYLDENPDFLKEELFPSAYELYYADPSKTKLNTKLLNCIDFGTFEAVWDKYVWARRQNSIKKDSLSARDRQHEYYQDLVNSKKRMQNVKKLTDGLKKKAGGG
jgi:hypothetical protein